ncbi:transposase family protein [Listeria booriae]|uniref:transposase family protein n=1 Tax=Listeria booriae TaxID=1552123 RepID=UPI0016262FC7|nr:transposase family protein [Listeria booriae]
MPYPYSIKAKKQACPQCKTRTDRIKDYRIHMFQHLKTAEKRIIIHYRKRRKQIRGLLYKRKKALTPV